MWFKFVIFALYLVSTISANHIKLKLLQIVFRNGIRTPATLYPTTLYNITYWNQFNGLGQLTPQGLDQMAAFGSYINTTYSSFLTQPYNPSRVYARATSTDRVISSAAALLSGIYTPVDNQTWSQNWLPIPIHSNDKQSDLIYPADVCARYLTLKNMTRNSAEYYQQQQDNIDFIKTMSNYSGISDLDLYRMSIIADNYIVANALNLSSPDWVLNNLSKILDLNDNTFRLDLNTTEMAQLVSGSLFNELVKNINNSVNGGSSMQLYLYATNDNYIAGLIKLLNLAPIKQPQFASALFFELYQSTNSSDYFIQLFYKNNINGTITRDNVTIEGCDQFCNLNKFFSVVSSKWVQNITGFCNTPVDMGLIYLPAETNYTSTEIGLIVALSVVGAAFLAALIALICTCGFYVCRKGHKYVV